MDQTYLVFRSGSADADASSSETSSSRLSEVGGSAWGVRQIFFRFGRLCYCHDAEMPRLGLRNFGKIISSLQHTQDQMPYVGDYNLLNSKEGSIIFSRFTTPIEEMRNVASFCLAELERLEDRLEELSSSGGHTWLASAGDDEHDDSGVFFVLSCRSTPDSMSLLDVAIAKMHVGGAIFDVVFHASKFYITLAEQDGDHMLLDTRFPDFSARKESVELASYDDGGKFLSLTAVHSSGGILKAGSKFSVGSYADAVKDRAPRFVTADEAKHADEVEEKAEGKVEEGLRLEVDEGEDDDQGSGHIKPKSDEHGLTIPDNDELDGRDGESQEESPMPAGDDVEILKGGYHQVYVVLKDPGGTEGVSNKEGAAASGMATRHRVLVRCGRWCYEGVVDLGFTSGELSLEHLPAVIPFLHSQQDKLVYAYDYTKLPKFSPFRQPLRRLYDATKTLEVAAQEAAPTLQNAVESGEAPWIDQVHARDHIVTKLRQVNEIGAWIADGVVKEIKAKGGTARFSSEPFFELATTKPCTDLWNTELMVSKVLVRGIDVTMIYFGGSFYAQIKEADPEQPLLATAFPDVSQKARAYNVRAFRHSEYSRLTLWEAGRRSGDVEEARSGSAKVEARVTANKVRESKEEEETKVLKSSSKESSLSRLDLSLPREQVFSSDLLEYTQTYIIMKAAVTEGDTFAKGTSPSSKPSLTAATVGSTSPSQKKPKVDVFNLLPQHEVFFRFGKWCYKGTVGLDMAPGLRAVPLVVPLLHAQQSKLTFMCPLSNLPPYSSFYRYLARAQHSAVFLANKVMNSLTTLEEKAQELRAKGDAVWFDAGADGITAYFELKIKDGDKGVMAELQNVSLMITRTFVKDVAVSVMYYGGSFFAVLEGTQGDQPLLETSFPDVSTTGNGFHLETFAVGDYAQMSIWEIMSGMTSKAVGDVEDEGAQEMSRAKEELGAEEKEREGDGASARKDSSPQRQESPPRHVSAVQRQEEKETEKETGEGDDVPKTPKKRTALPMRKTLISGRLAPLQATISDKSKRMISALGGGNNSLDSLALGKPAAPWDKTGAPLGQLKLGKANEFEEPQSQSSQKHK